jgi:hypothetical protein
MIMTILNLNLHAVIVFSALSAQRLVHALTIGTEKIFTSPSDSSILYWGPSSYTQTLAANASGLTDCLATLVTVNGELDVATWQTLLAEWHADDVWTEDFLECQRA